VIRVNGLDTLQNALVAAILGWMVGGLRRETRRAFDLLHGEIGGLRGEMREEIGALRTEMREEIGALRTEMREEIGALRAEMREEIGALRTETHDEIRALRSDLTQVALALGVRRRAGNE
jgi:hypothetical protein